MSELNQGLAYLNQLNTTGFIDYESINRAWQQNRQIEQERRDFMMMQQNAFFNRSFSSVSPVQTVEIAPPIDPRIQSICDAAKKEIDAKRAQLIEAAKEAPPAPPMSAELKEVVIAAVRKRNPHEAMMLADMENGSHNTQCTECENYTAYVVCDACRDKQIAALETRVRGDYLLIANNKFDSREQRELHPGAAFRWTYRMS